MSYEEYKEAGAVRDNLIDSVLDLARGELGVTEDAGSDEDSAGHIAMYRASVTDQNVDPNRGPEAWCACFISWVFREVGMALGVDGQGFRSCSRMKKWLQYQGRWRNGYYESPQPADIIFIDGDRSGDPDHCGIIERVEGDTIHTIEGNYGDRCTRVARRNRSIIHGFGIIIE